MGEEADEAVLLSSRLGGNNPILEKSVSYRDQITHLVEEGAPAKGTMTLPSQTREGAWKLPHLLTPKKSILAGTWPGFKLRLKRHHRAKSQRAKYNTECLSNSQVAKTFKDILSREDTDLQLKRMEGWTINEVS